MSQRGSGSRGARHWSRHALRELVNGVPRLLIVVRSQCDLLSRREEAAEIHTAHGGDGVLLHDFQAHTAAVTGELLNELKAKGYKIVHMRAKAPVTTLTQYDEMARAEFKGLVGDTRPTSTVVTTVPTGK